MEFVADKAFLSRTASGRKQRVLYGIAFIAATCIISAKFADAEFAPSSAPFHVHLRYERDRRPAQLRIELRACKLCFPIVRSKLPPGLVNTRTPFHEHRVCSRTANM